MFEVRKMFDKLMNLLVLLNSCLLYQHTKSQLILLGVYGKEETRNRLYFIYRYVNVLYSKAGNKKLL